MDASIVYFGVIALYNNITRRVRMHLRRYIAPYRTNIWGPVFYTLSLLIPLTPLASPAFSRLTAQAIIVGVFLHISHFSQKNCTTVIVDEMFSAESYQPLKFNFCDITNKHQAGFINK